MIDIHHHCLPDVDDGPRSWAEAELMCRAAHEEGIEAIVATPHVLRGRWRQVGRAEIEERVAELRERIGGAPAVHLGSEAFFTHDLSEALKRGAIIPLAGSRYVLVELAADNVPPHVERPLFAMQLDGWTPVIAHPERNIVLQKHPEILAALVESGVKVQVTAASFTGGFGRAAQASAEAFLEQRLVHFVATDAHNAVKRPPRVQAATTRLERLGGAALARALTVDNPLAVVENRPLPHDPDPLPRQNGFFTRVRAFLRGDRA